MRTWVKGAVLVGFAILTIMFLGPSMASIAIIVLGLVILKIKNKEIKKGAILGGIWGFISYYYYFLLAWGMEHRTMEQMGPSYFFPSYFKILAFPSYVMFKQEIVDVSFEVCGAIIILIGVMMGGGIGYFYGRWKEI